MRHPRLAIHRPQELIAVAALTGFLFAVLMTSPGSALASDHTLAKPIPELIPIAGFHQPRLSNDAVESAETTEACTSARRSTQPNQGSNTRNCPRLPDALAPSSLGKEVKEPHAASKGRGGVVALVTNEAGDSIEVSNARPGRLEEEEGEGGGTIYSDCTSPTIPYLGGSYDACGYVSFYDAGWESTHAPNTNVEEDAEYDACGELVSSGKTTGWHLTGTNYTDSGWHQGHPQEIPTSEPPACLGTWTELYSFTETFSDKTKLTDSIKVPFLVTAVPVPPDSTWGGGNPSEFPCSQICAGDPVNTATGDYSESVSDLTLPSRGPGIDMTRTYSSLAAKAGVESALGRGWAFPYAMSLSIDEKTGDATVTNENGSRTSFEAGPEGSFEGPTRVLASLVENEDGSYTYTIRQKTIYTFDSSGKLVGIADLNGDETTLAYDESGRLESATDEAERSLTFEYDESGRLEGLSDSTGRSVGYGYDKYGYLSEVTDVRGNHERYTYSEGGLLLTREDARGHVVMTNTYDSQGRVLTQTDGLENQTKYAYTKTEALDFTTVTNPRGYTTKYEYANGILASRVDAANTSYKAKWTYEYDPITLGRSAVTDPNGHTSYATYDEDGNRTSTEDALGHTTESAYDSLGDLLESTDANGVTTTYEYDERGNLLGSSTPLVGSEPPESRTTSYAHDDEEHPGDVTSMTDPNGKTTHFTYDLAGDLMSETDPAGDETTYEYDERGNRRSEVSPRGNLEGGEPAEFTSSWTYDAAGNPLTATDPLGHEREWAYDPDGNVESETDPKGHTTSFAYDADNRRVTVEQPNGQTEQTAYDEVGNVEAQTDGLEHTTNYTYDPLDELKTSTDPLERSTEYRYDQAGNLHVLIDPMGQATDYFHNQANQLTEVEYEEEAMPTVEYEYDPDGRRISMIDGTGETSYEYDSLGRLTSTTDGHGDTTAYGYDLAGNETAVAYPNGKIVTRGFDEAERLASVTDWLGNTTSFSYDADSNLKSTTFPEGTANVDEYGYDQTGRMSEVTMSKGIETLAAIGYSRDENGQIESLTAEGLPGPEEEAFEYDENGRLTQAGSETFEYDAADNLTEAPGTVNGYDPADQLETGTGVSYRYNELGERVEERAPTAVYLSSIGSPGAAEGQFEHPAGLAADGEGDLWVADEENNRVEEFDEEGEFIRQFGSEGSEEGQFERPTDVAVDSKGDLWVTDAGNNRVEEFDEEGEFIRQFGSEGSEEGQFAEPESIAVDPGGHVWVADTYNGRVQEFSSEGKFIKVIGEYGSEEGQMAEPTGIAICPGGDIWVADYGNERVEEFNSEGEFVLQFGTFGSGKGQFEEPDAIDVDAEGSIWVADEGSNRVQKFDPEGEYLGEFGHHGSGKGQFSFGWPMGLATGPEGTIWISDAGNGRVQKWEALAPSENAPTTYDYDQAGNLTGVERSETGEDPGVKEDYAYDGDGLRTSQTVSGKTSYLTWNTSAGLPLLLNDGHANYIYGPGELPIEQIVESTPTYYHHDQLGSTRILTDASGNETGAFTYGAYGALVDSEGKQTTPLGYAGQYTNAESGLQYLRSRAYDPATGQFLSRDLLATTTGVPYGYANENPLQYVDPAGTCGIGSVGEALESINPFSEENCAYQATKALVDLLGGDAETIATVAAGFSAAILVVSTGGLAVPLAAALGGVAAAASAYAAGENAANGKNLQAAIDALGAILGGEAGALKLLSKLQAAGSSLSRLSAAARTTELAEILDELGYADLAASLLYQLCSPE